MAAGEMEFRDYRWPPFCHERQFSDIGLADNILGALKPLVQTGLEVFPPNFVLNREVRDVAASTNMTRNSTSLNIVLSGA